MALFYTTVVMERPMHVSSQLNARWPTLHILTVLAKHAVINKSLTDKPRGQ